MELADLARWHWALLGILAGLAVGFGLTGLENEGDPSRSMSIDTFRWQLTSQSNLQGFEGQPSLTDVLVGKPQPDYRGKPIQIVKLKELRVDKETQKPVRVERELYAPIPFDRFNREPENTVVDFIKARQARFNFITYREASATDTYKTYLISAGVGLFVVGGIWPSIVMLMTGGSTSRAERAQARLERQQEKQRRKASRRAQSTPDLATGKLVTAGERAELTNVNQRLAASVGPIISTAGAASPQSQPVNVAIKKLDGGRLESDTQTPTPVASPEKPVDFKGEWYPVARTFKKSED